MKFPSKFLSYKESYLSKFPYFLEALEEHDLSVLELYRKLFNKCHLNNKKEFIDILVCLFAMKKITLEEDIIHYVKTN